MAGLYLSGHEPHHPSDRAGGLHGEIPWWMDAGVTAPLLRNNFPSLQADYLIAYFPGLLSEPLEQLLLVLAFIRLLPLI